MVTSGNLTADTPEKATGREKARTPEPLKSAEKTLEQVIHAVDKSPNSVTSDKPKPEFTTAGERLHNEATYRIIDWIINSAIGVSVTYWSTKTKSGQEYFAKPVANFFKTILKPVLKNEKSLEEGAKWGGMFTSIIVGGMSIIPPMMILEKPKVKTGIIRWLDEKWYGKKTVENDPKFEEAYQRIAAEPKQGFWIGMAARLAVLAPMIAVTVVPATNNFMIKYLYDPIARGTKFTAEKLGIRPAKMMAEGDMVHPQGNTKLAKVFQSNWDFLHETIGFDLGLTFIYSFCHEYAYKGMASLFGADKKKTAPAPETTPVVMSAPQATVTDSTATDVDTEKKWASTPARRTEIYKPLARPVSKKSDEFATAVTNEHDVGHLAI